MVGPAPPNWEQQLYVMGDSSERGYGGVLANMDDDKNLKPLAFKSAHYNEQGQRRASVAREAFCSGCLLHHWRWCLLGAEFTFISIANV